MSLYGIVVQLVSFAFKMTILQEKFFLSPQLTIRNKFNFTEEFN